MFGSNFFPNPLKDVFGKKNWFYFSQDQNIYIFLTTENIFLEPKLVKMNYLKKN